MFQLYKIYYLKSAFQVMAWLNLELFFLNKDVSVMSDVAEQLIFCVDAPEQKEPNQDISETCKVLRDGVKVKRYKSWFGSTVQLDRG